jgi:hypothetical protein
MLFCNEKQKKKRMLIRTIKYRSKVPAVVASASGFNNARVPCCLLCVVVISCAGQELLIKCAVHPEHRPKRMTDRKEK